MNFLEKLNYLMKQNNMNKSMLSKACDIPYTTIDGWYKRGFKELKLPTLKKLSNYFDVSLDYWADDELIEPIPRKINDLALTKKEAYIITTYRNASTEFKDIIEKLIEYEHCK